MLSETTHPYTIIGFWEQGFLARWKDNGIYRVPLG
jgi:hypothetical protein